MRLIPLVAVDYAVWKDAIPEDATGAAWAIPTSAGIILFDALNLRAGRTPSSRLARSSGRRSGHQA